jgi:hypothetical protein
VSYNPTRNVPALFCLHVEDRHVTARKQINVDYLVREYLAGRSELQLSREMGIDRNGIRRRLVERGITPRGRSEAERMKWRQMAPEVRAAQVAAAHIAVRGTHKTLASKIAHAQTVERLGLHISPIERRVARLLKKCGVDIVHQQAIGPYNCDLGAFPVAVEIFGGHWHFYGRHLQRTPERFRYLLNTGWFVLAVVVSPEYPLHLRLPDYIVSYIQQARSQPSARREYRVIRGAGETLAAGSADDEQISLEWAFTNRRNPATGRYESVPR